MAVWQKERAALLDQEHDSDVLVVGSGSAGLVAALRTSSAGLNTVMVEKTEAIGGTTAMSAAGIWAPANHLAHAAGIEDSPEEALSYLRAVAPDGWRETEDLLWQRFVMEAPAMLSFVERHSPLRFALTAQPDPWLDRPGARPKGRMVSPEPLRPGLVGSWAGCLRPPMLPHIFTYQEALASNPFHRPLAAALAHLPRLAGRLLSGHRTMGTALVTGLLHGCLNHGCSLLLGARAVELIVDETGAVRGAVVERSGRRSILRAKRGVVLASGGFEGNPELLDRYFPGSIDYISSAPGNDGDGHRMAEAAGADFAHMDQANLGPAIPTVYGGRVQGLSVAFHHTPGSLLVNRYGRRFVNEFRFNIGEIIDERNASGYPAHLPAWLIADARLKRRSPLLRWYGYRERQWIRSAPDIMALAEMIGVPGTPLAETVKRFNEFCHAGYDAEFGRGHEPSAPNSTLGGSQGGALRPIDRAPFLAIPFNRSFITTKGGPRTNGCGQVLRPDGSVIPGLYCAGTAMANPIGTWAAGAGTVLGPNMTWGYICGSSLLD